ncbi:valine--tRNA ligase [Pelotomaculum sp. PtaB.Bin117]|uniref:valine--tRNA ligase n=1 Tax=Pelotomaculum sp. PtaB.Bin117 TaxID=1811694 RepID=UPI0009D182A4|nr:valine--tRNA ligase [Pelotomaculum sp. PtaB.Bin117]OPX91055.1 MAG: Valine--tRNA ligase [Pelotomaculum sp. PtaB.Bin117]OPY62639.1 MAG: Valine--tRNA ligase [Pelotomaculum sp. PtaU1.Bin065]
MAKADIPSTYDPRAVEDRWYPYWENGGFFHIGVNPEQKPFCIVMPPPNVTGQLHMGHALDYTLQDILTRWRRMQGYNSLWVPGTDHAGIATQAKVEEQLAKEGTSRYEIGREAFLKRAWAWKEQYGSRITAQLRRLGASCDWQRERFTMDEGCSEAVREVFIRLFERGLIYRDYYITNWCPKCHTTISDIEVEHIEKPGHFWYLKYPFKDGDGHVVVATTRPETVLGDTAVAVHPDDERYAGLIGKMLVLPLVGREMPLIADEYVDPSFGTGAVKITPAHDPNDFEVGYRHGLEQIIVIDKEGKMSAEAGPRYQGLDRYDCRKKIVRDLEAGGYLLKTEDLSHGVGHCYRCNTVIEPMLSRQWFVKMKPLAEQAIEAAKAGDVRFIPERFTKVYLSWMENIRDWCISRQLWWGHRIPVWYCKDCDETIASKKPVSQCPKCGGTDLEQDPDVLDTWFSSALWPFSTLGWPKQTIELAYYYPTSVLVTGRDIIFFWVARMIFSGLAFMNDVPFRVVSIHGMVLDALGRKMSKSLGNGVDPIDVIESHGADSLRFMLVTSNTPGNDLRFNFEKLDGARNFANKLWNASRFVLMNLEDFEPGEQRGQYTLADRWIISRYQNLAEEVTRLLESYELGEAARVLYEFIWNEFCDWYIELAKPRLYGKTTPQDRYTAQSVLTAVLKGTLELLHPFMPFITEEIWQHLPGKGLTVMRASWPVAGKELADPEAERQMEMLMEVTKAIRHIRSEMNVPPGKQVEAYLEAPQAAFRDVLERGTGYIQGLANAKIAIFEALKEKPEQAAHAVTHGAEVFVPLKGLIDIEQEAARLRKELAVLEKDLARVNGKLNNQGFLSKAPADVIEKEKKKENELTGKQTAIRERLSMLVGGNE